jgi:predicted transcriptional regulator
LLLLAVHPKYAKLIINGEKLIEFRRNRPHVVSGQGILIYSTSPEMALVGTCYLGGINEAATSELWMAHQDVAGVDQREFEAYFAGRHTGIALSLVDPYEISEPISLNTLRVFWPGFNPPRSYRYIPNANLETMPGLDHFVNVQPNGSGR